MKREIEEEGESNAEETHIKDLKNLVDAWESLPEGHYNSRTISDWLFKDMKPVVDGFRKKIKNSKKL